MGEKDVTAVIVNYKTVELVLNLSQELLNYGIPIVVVDNEGNSNLRKELPAGVKYIEAGENTGYSGGNNIGLQECSGQSDYALILNPDVSVSGPELVDKLVEECEMNDSLGIVAPKVIEAENKVKSEDTSFIEIFLRKFGYLPSLPKNKNSLRFASSVMGCVMLVDMDLHHRINGFDERFFMYREEIDYCYRAQHSGFRVGVCEEVSVEHDEGEGDFKHSQKYQLYYYIRNGFLLAQNSFDSFGRFVYTAFSFLSIVSKLFIIVLNKRFSLLPPLLFGFLDGILGKYGRRRYPK